MRPKVPASRKQEEAPDADKSDDSIKVGDIRASKRLSQIMQLLLKVRKKHLEAGEPPIERNKFIIAPDGYVPNSTVRSFVTPHKYARFVEKTLPSGKAEIGPDLLDTIYYCLMRYNTLKENQKLRARGQMAVQTEAKAFQQFVNLEESKRMTNLLKQIKLPTADRVVDTYDMKHKLLSKQMQLMQLKSETLRRRRAEIHSLVRQQISIKKAQLRAEQKAKAEKHRTRNLTITVNPASIALTSEDMAIMEDKVLKQFGNRSSMFEEVEKFLNFDTEAMEAMAKALGSDERAQQFVGTLKQPKYLLEYLKHKFGGLDRVFSLIDAAIMGDLDAIQTMARAVGQDTDAIVKFVAYMEKTSFAAANCLQTKPRNYPYVEDYISLLLKRDWSESELKDLANGRFKEELQPGDLPITNPLTTIATGISEELLIKFYKALKTADHEFFTGIGNIKFEQESPRGSSFMRRSSSSDDDKAYAEVLADLEKPENRFILRPPNELLKEVAAATNSVPLIGGNDDHLPVEVSRYFAHLVARAQLVMAASVIMQASTEVSPLEEISELIYNALTQLNNAIYHLKKAGGAKLDEKTAGTIASEVMRGNINEAYRMKMIMGSKMGGHLVHCLQVAHGRLLDKILRYVLMTNNKEHLNNLLGEYLDAYQQKPLEQELIYRWLTFVTLAFRLAHEVGIAESIPDLVKSFQSAKFYHEAGIPFAAKRMRAKDGEEGGSGRLRSQFRAKVFVTRKFSKRRAKKRPGQMTLVEQLDVQSLTEQEQEGEQTESAEPTTSAVTAVPAQAKVDLSEEDFYELELPKTQAAYKLKEEHQTDLVVGIPLSRYKGGKKIVEGTNFDETMKEAWASLAELQNIDPEAMKDWGEEEVMKFKEKIFMLLWKFVNAIANVPRMKRQNERMQKGLAALGPWVRKKNVSLNTKMLLWKTVANLKNIGTQGNMETTYYRLKKVLEDLKQDISDEDVDTAVRLALRRKVSLAGQSPKEEEAEEEEDEVDLVEESSEEEIAVRKGEKVAKLDAKTQKGRTKDGAPKVTVPSRPGAMRSDSLIMADMRMQDLLTDMETRSHSSRIATEKDVEEASSTEATDRMSSSKSIRKGTGEEGSEGESDEDSDVTKGMWETDFAQKKKPMDITLDLNAAKGRLGAGSKDSERSKASSTKGKKSATGSSEGVRSGAGSIGRGERSPSDEAEEAAMEAALAIASDSVFINKLGNLLSGLFNKDGSPVDEATKANILNQLVALLQSKGLPLEEAMRLAKAMLEAKLQGNPFDLTAELAKALKRLFKTKGAAALARARGRKGPGSPKQRALSILDWREILRSAAAKYDEEEKGESESSSSTSLFPRSLSSEGGMSPSSRDSSSRVLFRAHRKGEWGSKASKHELAFSHHRKDSMEVSSSETISTAGSDASPITSSSLEMEIFSGSTDLDDYYMRADEGPYVRDPNEPWFSDEDVVGHIVECLSATTKISPKALRTFKSVLLCIADDEKLPPKLSQIFKQARGLQSPFAHDSDMKQLFFFKDVVRTLAEAKLIKQENASTYTRQIARRTDWLLQKFAQIGFIYLNHEDEEALFKIHDALINVTSATLEEWADDSDVLVDGVLKLPKMSTHQLVALLLTGELEKTRIRRSFLPPVTKLPPSRVASTVIIVQSILPLLPLDAIKDAARHADLPRSLQRIEVGKENNIQHMLRKVKRATGRVTVNDIDALATKAREQSVEFRRRVSQRVSLLGVGGLIEDYQDEEEGVQPAETRKRMILRPSWIKPGEWHQLVGKSRVSVVRFDETALCHRAEYPVSTMVKADQQEGLSHHLVANYDLLHAFNRHSLAQLAHICSIKKNER